MKQRRINATLAIAALALAALLILSALPRAGTAAPRLERQPLESLSALNAAEVAERGVPLSAFSAPSAASVVQSPGTTTHVSAALRSAPVMFIENVGQFDEHARFRVWGGSGTMWLAEDAIWITIFEQKSEDAEDLERDSTLQLRTSAPLPRCGVHLKLTFPGANPHSRLEPFDRLDTVVSYFIGNEPAKRRPAVPVWGGVRYKDLYPGIDLEITGENSRMVQRLITHPGADLSTVRLRVEGADSLRVDGDRLRLTTAAGDFTLPLLQAVEIDGSPLPVLGEAPGVRANEITAPFSIAPPLPDASPQLAGTSDLLYATFLGGSSIDRGYGIAVDGSGATYVTGETISSDFPTTPGAFDVSLSGESDCFAAKLDATGSSLAYATFLGSSSSGYGQDLCYGIAVDSNGAVYLTGEAAAADFPTTPEAFDTTYNGGDSDAFVVKLNANGTALGYATFLGGSSTDYGSGITVDEDGAAYVTGSVSLTFPDFPTTPGAFDTTYNGGGDVFAAKLNTMGSALIYSTFLGGNDRDYGLGIVVDGNGAAYVTGATGSPDFPTTPDANDTSCGTDGNCNDDGSTRYSDAFIAKLNANASTLVYSSFLGGGRYDVGEGIATDGSGAAYVTGGTGSSDFPTTPGAFDTTCRVCPNGNVDAFVVKLNAAGSALAYATFLGGSTGGAVGVGIAVEGTEEAYIIGRTTSADFPTTAGAFDTTLNSQEAFVVKLAMPAASTPTPTPTALYTPTPTATPTPTPTATNTPSVTPTPAIITVNTFTQGFIVDGLCSLAEAIQAANTNTAVDGCVAGGGADTIILPAGTYSLMAVDNTSTNGPNGLPIINTTVTISGAGADATTIHRSQGSSPPFFRFFEVASVGTLTINGLTAAGGNAGKDVTDRSYGGSGIYSTGRLTIIDSTISANTPPAMPSNVAGGGGIYNAGTLTITHSTISDNTATTTCGGGLFNDRGTVTITDSDVYGNTAGNMNNSACGGGIYNYRGTLVINNSAVFGNTSHYHDGGGGIYSLGTLVVTNSTLSDNSAYNSYGGGICSNGTLTITSSIFAGNRADRSGGGLSYRGDANFATIADSTFSGNAASDKGGGIYKSPSYSTMTISNSRILDNSARTGGGLFSSGMLIVTSGRISYNRAIDYGGGIAHAGGQLDVTDGTISNNTAAVGGGIANTTVWSLPIGTVNVGSSTLSSNNAPWGGGVANQANGIFNIATRSLSHKFLG